MGSALIADHVVGLEMLCYLLSHEAHHRGKVCMLVHQLGYPLPNEVAHGIWNWESSGKSAGRLAAPATILKKSLKGTGRLGMGLRWWRHRAQPLGLL